jgi:hypothetical protein
MKLVKNFSNIRSRLPVIFIEILRFEKNILQLLCNVFSPCISVIN